MKGDLLIVIDMQNVYKKGGKWECLNTEKAAENIIKIAESGKCDNVILTRFIASENPEGAWNEYNSVNAAVNNDEYANQMLPELEPLVKKYPLFTKSVYSSLKHPDVLAECRKYKRVIVTGVVAECCVLSTVFELIDYGIYTVYITDGVSGLDEPKEKATELMLEGLSPLHLKMMTTKEYLEEK